MLKIRVSSGRFHVGSRFSFRLERTLRVPDDGRAYPLPPSFGPFPVYRPRGRGNAQFIVPVYQHEALWLSFDAAYWKPNAVLLASGRINVLTGRASTRKLRARPQNYIVCPEQPWLDGFKTASGVVRQFVAAPLGQGLTVEEQLSGAATGGLTLTIVEPKPGIFPSRAPRGAFAHAPLESVEVGLAAGGAIQQKIYPDPYGLAVWDESNVTTVSIALLNSATFHSLAGHAPPPSPISAADYARLGFPWFQLYDDHLSALPATPQLEAIGSLHLPDEPTGPLRVKTLRLARTKGSTHAH